MDIILMDKVSKLLDREKEERELLNFLDFFVKEPENTQPSILSSNFKRGLYIYGDNGVGKTEFVLNILKKNGYDFFLYNSENVRNKSIIETITKVNMYNNNVLSMFNKKSSKKQIIIMDEIDSIINNDKGGILSLIKILKIKKCKKDKKGIIEEKVLNPIICIGNRSQDKKILDLIKVCSNIELKTPTKTQIEEILDNLFPKLNQNEKDNFINYINGNLKKLNNIYKIYNNNNNILTNTKIFNTIFQNKINNDNIKLTTYKLLNTCYNIENHSSIINDADRTIVGLLFHENIIDKISKINKNISIPFYLKFLENVIFADYIDRVTFQKQIWTFNEMSSLIKTFKNNKLYFDSKIIVKYDDKLTSNLEKISEVRFSRVLTKYSSQFNNECFIIKLCQILMLSKNELFILFTELKEKYNGDSNSYIHLFDKYDGLITKLDINRIQRYLDKAIIDSSEITTEVELNEKCCENFDDYKEC